MSTGAEPHRIGDRYELGELLGGEPAAGLPGDVARADGGENCLGLQGSKVLLGLTRDQFGQQPLEPVDGLHSGSGEFVAAVLEGHSFDAERRANEIRDEARVGFVGDGQQSELDAFVDLTKMAVAVNCWFVPLAMDGLAGAISIDCTSDAVTVTSVSASTLWNEAETVALPCSTAVSRPLLPAWLPTVATDGADETQLASAVTS